ncbi:hypothetical protein D3261_02680 [Halococcus sp. IIIV-5B]|nr:hypothetical protein D3261_02680 [Halococcus sp. IIIV-5B]
MLFAKQLQKVAVTTTLCIFICQPTFNDRNILWVDLKVLDRVLPERLPLLVEVLISSSLVNVDECRLSHGLPE